MSEMDLSGQESAVDVKQLTEAIQLILKDADLEQLSRRMIRKQLEAHFHTDLSNYKDVINATILETIEQLQANEEGEEEVEEDQEPEPSEEEEDADDEQEKRARRNKTTPKKKKAISKKRKRKAEGEDRKKTAGGGGFNAELCLSPELAQVLGAETMARPQVVKALWAYIREHKLQDPNNKQKILLDDGLRGVFQRDSFTMFSMNKFVKRHVRKPEDMPPGGWSQIPRDGVSSDEDEEKVKKKATKRKKKTTSTEKGDEEGEKKKKANPFNMELSLSPELASLVGSDRMARPQIVKALWAYIHEHNLQDPQNKRMILLDDRMRQVFKRDSFTMFTMNKFIKRHARKESDLPPGGWAEIPRDGQSSDEDESKKGKKGQ